MSIRLSSLIVDYLFTSNELLMKQNEDAMFMTCSH